MAFVNLKFFSTALGMQTEVYCVIPQKNTFGEIGTNHAEIRQNEKFKCLYLLHGLSDDHSIWLRRTSIERYADKYGIAVVMPMAAKSFYTDMKYGLKYYTYISQELPFVIREFFNISEKREDNFIAGLSMGGYGAMKIALKNPDAFCAAVALSPAADVGHWKNNDLFIDIFGDVDTVPEDEDLFVIAEKQANQPNKPRLYVAIGTEDFLYDEVGRLMDVYRDGHYDLTYIEAPGSHTWEFWDEHIQNGIEWMLNR